MLEHHDFGLSLKVANIQHSALSGMKMISNPPFSLKHKLITYTLNLPLSHSPDRKMFPFKKGFKKYTLNLL